LYLLWNFSVVFFNDKCHWPQSNNVTTTCALCMISKRHKQHRFRSASARPRAFCLCLCLALPRLRTLLPCLASASTSLPRPLPLPRQNCLEPIPARPSPKRKSLWRVWRAHWTLGATVDMTLLSTLWGPQSTPVLNPTHQCANKLHINVANYYCTLLWPEWFTLMCTIIPRCCDQIFALDSSLACIRRRSENGSYLTRDPRDPWPMTHDYSPVTVTVWRLHTLGRGKDYRCYFDFTLCLRPPHHLPLGAQK